MFKLNSVFGKPVYPLSIAALLATPVSTVLAAEAADSTALEEIIITAQKRNERLQDVPVAASVIAPTILLRANANEISDLNKLVPSVQLKGSINGRVPMGLRGVSTNANTNAVGLTSGVAIQIDGVPVAPDSFAANSLDDVAQVEVLKGPQATLGGRTASAGVINIVTGGPSDVFKAKASAQVTDDGERRANFAVAAPINDIFSFSVAGFGSHVRYVIQNTLDGKHTESENYGARGKLKFKPSDSFDATLMARYSHFRSDGANFTHQYLTPGANIFPFPGFGPGPVFGLPQSQIFPGIDIRYGNTKISSVNTGANSSFAVWKDTDSSLVLNYRTGNVTMSSTTAYQREKQNAVQDSFFTSVYFFNVLTGGAAPPYDQKDRPNADVKQFTQEFKIASDASLPLSYLAGLFYSDNKVIASRERAWVVNPESNTTLSQTKTAAAYTRVTGKLGSSTSITGGLRFNNDKITFQKTEFFDPTKNQYQGCAPLIGGRPAPAPPTCVLPTNKDSSDTVVGDISVQQKFAADSMVYGSYTRGYKPKAFNTAATFNLTTAGQPIDSLTQKATGKEKIDSFEVGLKAGLAGWGTLNVAVFHTTYHDYQAQVFPVLVGGFGVLELTNAGEARSQGIEADMTALVGDATRVTLATAYIDAKFIRFQNAPCYGDQTPATGCINGAQDLSGVRMPDSPRFKANLDIEHRIPLNNALELVLAGNYAYRTDARFQANNNPRAEQPAFGILNLSVGLDVNDGRYNVTLFANNVTDKFYLTNAENFWSGVFGPGANNVIGQPARDAERYFGVRVAAKF